MRSALDWMKRQSRVPRLWLVLVPLVVLGIDLAAFPVLFGGRSPTITVASTLTREPRDLGRFHAHDVMVDVSSVESPRYLSFFRRRAGIGLVISAFVTEKKALGLGSLGRAVRKRLSEAAPASARELNRFLDQAKGYRPGEIHDIAVSHSGHRDEFPVDTLYVAVMPSHDDEEKPKPFFEKLFKDVLGRAEAGHLKAIVVPPIGFNWEDRNTYEMDEFYRGLLSAIDAAPGEPAVAIELFSGWPTAILEEAVTAINVASEQIKPTPQLARVARWTPRVMYALFSLCLLVCSFFIPINLRNMFILFLGFTVFCLGEKEGIDTFFGESTGWTHDLVFLAMYALTAMLFPVLAKLDPKDVFKEGAGQ